MNNFKLVAIASVLILSGFKGAHAASPDGSLFERVSNRYQAVWNGTSFYYYTQDDRVQILTELFHSIEADYSLFEMKLKRFEIDFEALKKQSIEAERAIADTSVEAEQAKSNLSFVDRARKIVATFQDTHFYIQPKQMLNPVILPFSIAKADKKYVVVSRMQKLLAYLSATSGQQEFSTIALGDEVLAIDNLPVDQAEKLIEPYVSASSPQFREKLALQALTFRSFAFPENSYATVTIRKADKSVLKLKFPWFYRQPSRGDQALYLTSRNFTHYDQLRITWDDKTAKWKLTGISEDNPEPASQLPALMNGKAYVNPENPTSIAMQTGYLILEGKAFGVLQLKTFTASTLMDQSQTKADFFDVIRSFVRELKAAGVPLVLDLRSNGGGNGEYPAKLLSILAVEGAKYPGGTFAHRITRNVLELQNEMALTQTTAEVQSGLTQSDLDQIFADAIRNKLTYTAAYSEGDITPDPKVGGYSQPIVALVTSECISACDMMAMLLKSSGRAILIGENSNGTGAGYMSSGQINSKWTDSYRVLSTSIPNHLFGKPGGPAGQYVFEGQAEELSIENNPTTPHLPYEPTQVDLFHGGLGWLGTAIGVMMQLGG